MNRKIIGCEDICSFVISRLKDMGYDLDEHPDHVEILKILVEKVSIIDNDKLMSMNYPED